MNNTYNEIMKGVKATTSYPVSARGTTGLISRPEAEWLYRIPRVLGPGMYAELGTFRGRSACVLGETISKLPDSKLVTVDAFDDRFVSRRFRIPDADIYKTVTDLFGSRGLSPYILAIQSDTAEAASQFTDDTFRFLFIDAGHSYEAVKADFEAWNNKVEQDGIIAFHDSYKNEIQDFHSEIAGWKEFDRIDTLSVWRRV